MADDNPHATSYIHTLQHLIEECILFNMTKHECMDALSRHANIQPLITSTVWDELEKVNRDFFQGYAKSIQARTSTTPVCTLYDCL
ncbi:unnamed protein product [Rhodiola kirilowii]